MKKILIVEDEPAYANLLGNQLIATGYEVAKAKDGFEGLQLVFANKPDLILLDLLMPKVDGFTVLNVLRMFKWGEKIPVFVISNVDESSGISKAINSRVSEYNIKSDLKLEDLLGNIKIFLQRG